MTGILANAPVLALTVRPPWSHWLAAGIKTIENRIWAPPAGWRGKLVIHAGQTVDPEGFRFGANLGHHLVQDEVNRGEYLAVADLIDVHRAGPECASTCTPWGQLDCYHWVLADARRLVTVEGRGRQKLYVPPGDVIEQVVRGRER